METYKVIYVLTLISRCSTLTTHKLSCVILADVMGPSVDKNRPQEKNRKTTKQLSALLCEINLLENIFLCFLISHVNMKRYSRMHRPPTHDRSRAKSHFVLTRKKVLPFIPCKSLYIYPLQFALTLTIYP